jgi:hypothetical protein
MSRKKEEEEELVRKATYYNSFLIEAISELLAEKQVLTGEEVVDRVKRLRDGVTEPAWLN